MRDISAEIGHATVADVIDTFYNRIVLHAELKIPFGVVHDWPMHKQHLTHFWWVSLGGERYMDYQYQVPAKHAAAGFTPALLVPWLDLFRQTVRERVEPALAEEWIDRAERIGKSLQLMHEFAREQHVPRRHTLADPVVEIPE